VKRTEISVSAAELDKFVGRYDFGPGFVIAVAHALQIFPEALVFS
jgi:hypothetical protein